MVGKILVIIMISTGLILVYLIRVGQIDSPGLRMTLGVFAAWAIGSGLKVIIEFRKRK